MKPLQRFLQERTDESLRSLFATSVSYKPNDPNHKRLYASFIKWFEDARKSYDEDLILDMLMSAEEDIRYGEI